MHVCCQKSSKLSSGTTWVASSFDVFWGHPFTHKGKRASITSYKAFTFTTRSAEWGFFFYFRPTLRAKLFDYVKGTHEVLETGSQTILALHQIFIFTSAVRIHFRRGFSLCFAVSLGLFCREFGLFCREFGLFCREFGLFCREFGLFCRKFILFCREFGLFCREFVFCRDPCGPP